MSFILVCLIENVKRLLFLLFFIFSIIESSAQFISERQFFTSPDSSLQLYNRFGGFLTLNGINLIVGDDLHMYDLLGGNQMNAAGAVYSYTLNNDSLWNYTHKILSNDRFNGEGFGFSLDMSEDILAVGAFRSTLDTNQTNFLVDAGAVYIYEPDSSGIWKWKQKLIPSIRNMDDEFGYSVSLYRDVLAVGSHIHDYDSSNSFLTDAGSVFMFEKDSTGKFKETQHLVASDRHVDMTFGREVIFLNENELFVGAAFEGQNAEGAVYYFVRNSSGVWEEKQKIIASGREIGARFGDKNGIATTNGFLVIGAHRDQLDNSSQNPKMSCGAVYVFKRNVNGLWQQSARITAPFREWDMRFGSSVALSNSVLVIGAPFGNTDENNQDSIVYAGATYVYLKNATGDFDFYQKLVYQNRQKHEYFGGEICLSENYLIIGTDRTFGSHVGFCIFYILKDTAVGYTEYNPKFASFEAAIYPNPTSANFTLITNSRKLDRMKIYDVNGRLVHEENLVGRESAEVQLPDNILNGLYLVRIESGKEVVNKKLLVNGR